MDPNTALTALRAARQLSSLGGRKKGDVREYSALTALRSGSGSDSSRGKSGKSPSLASAPGHYRLIVEQLLAEDRIAGQKPGSSPKKEKLRPTKVPPRKEIR